MTTTWNGAKSLVTSGSGRLDLFYRVCRGSDSDDVKQCLEASFREDALDTLKILAYVRDCRGGKGEREVSRTMMHWLAENATEELRVNLLHLVSYFGRFDDLLGVMETKLEEDALQLWADQLREDLKVVHTGKGDCSLAAKWIPSEGKSADRKSRVCKKLARKMGLTPAELRKKYLSPIRRHLHVVERDMCANEWGLICFDAVPSLAMRIYGSETGAFRRHDGERFLQWKQNLASGKTKVNAKMLYPHQVVKGYMHRGDDIQPDELLEAQWKVMVEKGKQMGELCKTLVMSDVSHSMSGLPMQVSISLGILIASLATDAFKDVVLTFESRPRCWKVTGATLAERVQCLERAPWGGSTDFIAALRLILHTATSLEVPQQAMPSRLIVLSDMQFNDASEENFETNYEVLVREYNRAGYELPRLVFWNLNGRIHDVPTSSLQQNVSLISGFSIEVLKAVLDGDVEIGPFQTMITTIRAPRYDCIALPSSEMTTT